MEKPDTSLQPTPRKKRCVFSLVLHMVFDVPTHSRRSERHRLTSGQHRTQWSMFKLLLSLSHTHYDSPTYTNTQCLQILSHRTQCSQGVIYCKAVEASQTITVRLLHKAKGNGEVCALLSLSAASAHIFLPIALSTPFKLTN